MTDIEPNKPDSSQGYEKRDFNVPLIASAGLVALILFIIAVVVLYQFFIMNKERMIEDVVMKPVSAPLLELRSHEDSVLNSYSVVDSVKGVYQIPIDRAMKILTGIQANKNPEEVPGNRKAP